MPFQSRIPRPVPPAHTSSRMSQPFHQPEYAYANEYVVPSKSTKRQTIYNMGLEALSPAKGSADPGTIARLVVRFLQFVLGLTVAGLYGTDLAAASRLKAKMDMDWLYAVTVAGLSCLTTIIYFIPRVKSYKLFWWDFVMTVLWAALTGRFATMFLHPKPTDAKGALPRGASGPDVTRMHNAVYVDAVSLVLWGATWLYSTFLWWKQRRELKKAAMSGMA